MRGRDAGALGIVQDGCGGGFVNDLFFADQGGMSVGKGEKVIQTHISPSITQIGLFLFPKEIDAEILHEGRELIGHVLERLGTGLQRVQQLAVGVDHAAGGQCAEHALRCAG